MATTNLRCWYCDGPAPSGAPYRMRNGTTVLLCEDHFFGFRHNETLMRENRILRILPPDAYQELIEQRDYADGRRRHGLDE